jgi:hypothetical protein
MIRAKDVFFFNAANPGIAFGGFTMESKWQIQTDMNHFFFPKTEKVNDLEKNACNKSMLGEFSFPIIAKPDIGGKGRGVVEIKSWKEFLWYKQNCPLDFLIQEKISFPHEIGVFFVKKQDQKEGFISGIVHKKFIEIEGNGSQTIGELLESNPRYFLQLEALKRLHPIAYFERILAKNEKECITEIGSHTLGSKFEDASQKISPALTKAINTIVEQLPGFYFGRLDIRFASWSELEQLQNFKIIEINGAGSEPTHIYDSKHSLLFAWKEITKHWKWMNDISIQNRKLDKSHQLPFLEGCRLLLNHKSTMKKLDYFASILKIGSI